ncbi:GNAT family N-acetyltransferase [Kocuria sp. CPCC 205235]|uniref:GNAT family N-acetyltransferase n=1 Tax=Kocuria sp. CPCC 205235 TaxID=3073549 RepID=UPI0034D42F56
MVMIIRFDASHRDEALDLAIRAWAPVFPQVRVTVPRFVYDSFYPNGWEVRQRADLSEVLDQEPQNVDLALEDDKVVGWICTRIHPEDNMGEVYVLVVDPDHQRRGIASALTDHSMRRIKDAGMSMAMVETGDDPGHSNARATYEHLGFKRWPVARYFKDLTD